METRAAVSLENKGSVLYQKLIPFVVDILRRHRLNPAPRVVRLTSKHIVKYGSNMLAEARAIQFVSANTTVPVPKIIAAFQHHRADYYILMKRCPGVPLCNVYRNLSIEAKKDVLLQLRGYMDELRALKRPRPGNVGSTDYGPFFDERLRNSACGPFETVAEFHKAVTGGFGFPTGHKECDSLITAQNRRLYNINFTHGDLSFRHVYYLDGKITGIIDWESAGWYPDYWEYAMAWDSFWDSQDLRHDISEFLKPFPEEQKMEYLRQRLFRGMGYE